MLSIIQEIVKKINLLVKDTLSRADYIQIITLLCLLISFFISLSIQEIVDRKELIYHDTGRKEDGDTKSASGENAMISTENTSKNPLIVSAKGSRYYYYIWCSGAKHIKNKVLYQNEDEAKQAGKVLSKSCK